MCLNSYGAIIYIVYLQQKLTHGFSLPASLINYICCYHRRRNISDSLIRKLDTAICPVINRHHIGLYQVKSSQVKFI